MKFWRVEEARVWRAPVSSILKSSEALELVKDRNLPTKEGVEEALINMPVVPVAFTWKSAVLSSEAVVVAPTTNDLYGAEVAERKSPLETSSKVLPKEEPPVASSPSQRAEEPVMVAQKPAQVAEVTPLKVKLPERPRLVVVALVEVALAEVKFCRVVEPMTRRSPEELMVVVAVLPTLKVLALKKEVKKSVVVAAV